MAKRNGTATIDPEITGRSVSISPPKMEVLHVRINGTTPLVQLKFSEKARDAMMSKQEAGSTAKKGQKRDPRNFEQQHEDAKHISEEGWCGIPCAAFRNAMISACRLCGFAMTIGKLSIFIEPDGLDESEGTPLVKIIGEPLPYSRKCIHAVRNASGVADLRVRPRWNVWAVDLRIVYDADQFTSEDVLNLLTRAGIQVGVGEGRHDSKSSKSSGMGWGTFIPDRDGIVINQMKFA